MRDVVDASAVGGSGAPRRRGPDLPRRPRHADPAPSAARPHVAVRGTPNGSVPGGAADGSVPGTPRARPGLLRCPARTSRPPSGRAREGAEPLAALFDGAAPAIHPLTAG
ncbi:hypothetical protein [Streptomyces sulfonofaciens]|uniref:hypothetical protein n=1 Tax=Streptomyces sulfonofaciens TaxID=68272 RepID=UPI0016757666|nr:hypothetical protein [Streptomyces sulfonofaciens]